jgi:lipopolysaccharide transport system ATP-binding protein
LNPLVQVESLYFDYYYKPTKRSLGLIKKSVLSDINLTLNKSEILVILGKNGCGKSTLLRLLGKIYKPTSGFIKYYGYLSPKLLAPGVGFINDLTGMENLVFSFSLMTGILPKQDNVDRIKEYCEIGDRLNEPISIYSSGMRSRLAFATALECSSEVVLIDEALGAGDESFRRKVNLTYKRKIEEGMSFVVVTHNLNWVRNHATRVLVMNEGEICYDGPTIDGIEHFCELLGP